MRLVYSEAKVFQNLVDVLGKLVDEVLLVANEDGIEMKAMDAARTAMIRIRISKDNFLEYEVGESGESVGFTIANMAKFLKRAKKGYQLELGTLEEGAEIYVVLRGTLIKKYEFSNLEVIEPEIPNPDELDFKVSAVIMASVLKEALKDAEAVGDIVEFEARDDELIIRGIGTTESATKLMAGMAAVTELEVLEPSKARYDISYLKHILSLTKIAENVTIKFSEDAPLYLKFEIAAGGEVEYLLAPQA